MPAPDPSRSPMTQSRTFRLRILKFTSLLLVTISCDAETLNALLTRTYKYNPAIQGALAQVRATSELLPQARSEWLPTLALIGQEERSRIRQITDDRSSQGSLSQGIDETLTDRSLSLEMTLNLYDGGAKGANMDSAEAQVAAALAALDATVSSTLLTATQAYADVLLYRTLIDLNEEIERYLKKLRKEAEDLFKNRLITITDLAQARASLAQTQTTKISLQGSLAQAQSSYAIVSGGPPTGLERWRGLPPVPPTLKEVKERGRAHNPSIRAARFAAEAARAEIDVERGALWPSVDAYSTLSRSWDTSRYTSQADYTEFDREDDWTVGIQLEVPLFQGGRDTSLVREARAIYAEKRSQILSADNEIANAIETAWASRQTALAEQKSVAAEVAAYRLTLDGYRRQFSNGTSTIKDVVDARADLDVALENQVSVQYQQFVAHADLLSYMGQFNPRELGLAVAPYDAASYPEAVRNRLFGTKLP